MDKHLKLLILFFAVSLTTLGVLYLRGSQKTTTLSLSNPPSFPITTQAAPQTTTVGSSDGTHSVTMKEEKNGSGKSTFTFLISDQTIYTKTLDSGESFSIPFNAFSPDSKYLFLKETGKSEPSYIALTSEGTPITKDNQTITFSDLFAQKLPSYKITDVTGWASPTLIVINTDKLDGTQGPSFWFEIPTQSFILLSTRFN